jgi:hypothetical protein
VTRERAIREIATDLKIRARVCGPKRLATETALVFRAYNAALFAELRKPVINDGKTSALHARLTQKGKSEYGLHPKSDDEA